jgi:hypothetical protein
MHPHAIHAIRAAVNWTTWGSFAATRYAAKRGVPARLVRLARQLHATRELNNG